MKPFPPILCQPSQLSPGLPRIFHTRHPHRALHWTPMGKRKRGRPRGTYRRTIEEEMEKQVYTYINRRHLYDTMYISLHLLFFINMDLTKLCGMETKRNIKMKVNVFSLNRTSDSLLSKLVSENSKSHTDR